MKKTILTILTVIASGAQAFDHKACVIDLLKKKLTGTHSCVQDELSTTARSVQTFYGQCSQSMVKTLSAQGKLDISKVLKIQKDSYDQILEQMISKKISACGYQGIVTIKDRGKTGEVKFGRTNVSVTSAKGKASSIPVVPDQAKPARK